MDVGGYYDSRGYVVPGQTERVTTQGSCLSDKSFARKSSTHLLGLGSTQRVRPQ